VRKGTNTLDNDAADDDYNDDDGAPDNRRALSPIGRTQNTEIINTLYIIQYVTTHINLGTTILHMTIIVDGYIV
jgi:hypothetical protein